MSTRDRRPATRSKGDPSGRAKGRRSADSSRGASSAARALEGLSQPATSGSPNHGARAGMARDLQSTLGNQATAAVAGGGLSYKVNLPSTGGGEPLPAESRAHFEGAMGADLSDVRVHQDGQPEKLGTPAFTKGSDVHIARGRYDTESQAGRHILGHELAHVLQQREGRVQGDGSGTRLTEEPGLERDADHAASSVESVGRDLGAESSAPVGAGPAAGGVIQGLHPLLLKAGAWLASASTAQAATSVGAMLAVGAVGAQAGAAIAPGSTGVQDAQLESGWMSNADKKQLELIVQYRMINAYVARWIKAHGGEPADEEPPPMIARPEPVPAPIAAASPSEPPTGVPSSEAIDSALLATVTTDVELQIEELFNENQKEQEISFEFLWSDSGDHSADTFGTVGAIEFVGMKATYIMEPLILSAEALQIPGLDPARQNEVAFVKQFRGGRLIRGAQMETGMNDDLGINIVGGGPTIDQAGDDGHGIHTWDTAWNWDDTTTHWAFDVFVLGLGVPWVTAQQSRGEPED